MLVVTRHRGVHGQAPRVDTTRHALSSLDTLLPQPVDHVKAANAMMAVNDECAVIGPRFQLLDLAGYGAHRDKLRTFDLRQRKLVRLTHVDQMQLLTGIDTTLNLLRRNFQ